MGSVERYRSPFQIQSLRCAWSVAAVIVVRHSSGRRWRADPSLLSSATSGQGVDQVVQAERVWQLCPLCGKLLQIHTPSSASSIQVVVLAMVRQLGVTPKYVPSTMGARDSQRKIQIESQRKSQ